MTVLYAVKIYGENFYLFLQSFVQQELNSKHSADMLFLWVPPVQSSASNTQKAPNKYMLGTYTYTFPNTS